MAIFEVFPRNNQRKMMSASRHCPIGRTCPDTYRQLPEYCEKLKATNAGSVIALESTEENKFRRVFMSFGAQGTGFVHCRPIIGLDGTHLKSRYKGILLVATIVDARGISSPRNARNARNALMY